MMNQRDSQSDSINMEKPLSLDQQQQEPEMNQLLNASLPPFRRPSFPNMDLLKDSQSDSINVEKPLSLDRQQQHEKNNAVDLHAMASSSLRPSRRPNLPLREPNLANMDLLNGPREIYLKIAVPLYIASTKGDWKAAKAILNKYPEFVRYSITENGETSLHVAASIESSKKVEKFVENLVKLMKKEDLALENKQYCTALYLAARCGNIKTVKTMMEKKDSLGAIPGGGSTGQMQLRMMPLYRAALYGHYEVVNVDC